jgi:hypothetical protein
MPIELGVADFGQLGALLSQLPKNIRLIGEPSQAVGLESAEMLYEFEVVTGNASYKEGERFYLTPAQARRVYFSTQRN